MCGCCDRARSPSRACDVPVLLHADQHDAAHPAAVAELLNYDATTAGMTLAYGRDRHVRRHAAGRRHHRAVGAAEMADHGARSSGTGWALLSSAAGSISMWGSGTYRDGAGDAGGLAAVVFIPLSAVSYVGVPPDRTNEASAIINLLRNLGGSVGVSFTTTILQQRGSFITSGWPSISPRITAMAGTCRWHR